MLGIGNGRQPQLDNTERNHQGLDKAFVFLDTTGSVTAAEQPVRDQLEQVLPRGIAVGEGFVIDSYGGTSRQQDVVLYDAVKNYYCK